ncbi:hypothetical protein IWW50_001926 [Coemansia erecta]|nr:hypothetical protein IWW50_001926 [Coemansia erecta]
MEYQVQHIPLECLCELFRTGALDRVLALSTRDIGRLAINHFPPFRSLHSYGTVMHHLYKQQDMDFDTAADMCESTIAVNNTILSTTDPARKHDLSKLMLFLNTDVELEGRMMMQWTDDRTLTHDLWRDVFQSNMYCAMVSGQIIAHVKDDTVHECLQRLVDERCIIRPVFLYMFRQYIDDQETEVLMRNAQEQFHIYNMAIQIMQWNYQDKQDISMWYTQYTILFVIAEINDMIAQSVFKQDETAQLCSTVLAADINDNASEPGSPKDICYGDPLSSHELLCLLDWDFAAVIGFRLAHEFYEENQSSTAMLAKLNTKVHGVDTSNGQPFPLVEPVLDADFHQFVHRRVSAVYGKWQYGFSYMVLEEAIEAYNVIILDIRNRS